jgi:predicted porin
MQRLRKHLCLAFFGLLGTSASSAQSSVTLYGLVDGGLRYSLVSNEKIKNVSNVGLAYGTQSGNRWGIRGVESLGGGNSAFFQLESGFDLGNGTLGQSSRMFGRAAWLGLQNTYWGDVRLGRMTNLSSDWLVKFVDPFAGDLNQLNMMQQKQQIFFAQRQPLSLTGC